MRGWTHRARARALAVRREKRDAKRIAQALPMESIGQGRPRRSTSGGYVPRDATPLQVATLEVRSDIARGYVNPGRFMKRTEYKLRRDEFEIYRAQWSAIRQSIEDDIA